MFYNSPPNCKQIKYTQTSLPYILHSLRACTIIRLIEKKNYTFKVKSLRHITLRMLANFRLDIFLSQTSNCLLSFT